MPLPKTPAYRKEDLYSRQVIVRTLQEPSSYTKPYDIAIRIQTDLQKAGYKIVLMTEKDGKMYKQWLKPA